MKLGIKLLLTLSTVFISMPTWAGTTRMPVCLNYPASGDSIANQTPCTGVVPVDSSGNPLNWQTLFASGGGGGSGGSQSSSAAIVGSAPGSFASQTGYVGSDGNVHNWVGDIAGHPAVSIYGVTSVTLSSGLPAGTNAIGSITNTSFASTQSGTWTVGVNSLPSLPSGSNIIGTVNINGTVPVSGTFFQSTQPVSIAATVGTTDNITQIGGNAVATGTGTSGAGIPRVTVSNDSSLSVSNFPSSQAVTNAGTFAVQNTAALPVGSNLIGKVGVDQTTPGTTNGVVVNSSALPAGASTSALQTTGNTSVATVATNTAGLPTSIGANTANTAPSTAVQIGTFAATTSPLTWSAVTTTTTFGPWAPQLGRNVWSVFSVTGGNFTAVIGATLDGVCADATPLTAANGSYALGTFTAPADEAIGTETRSVAKWCVTITPVTGASVSGGLYQ